MTASVHTATSTIGRWRSSVDLHAHSCASDGELDPAALLRHAAESGVRVLALTDHDTVDGLVAARQAAQETGVALVAGVELSVTWERKTLHIVGLGIDPDTPALNEGLALLQQRRRIRATAIAARVERLGVADAGAAAATMAAGGQITRSHFARLLVEAGLCKDAKRAFHRFLSPGKPAYVAGDWATLEQALGWIRAAGGLPVLAHPRRYTLSATARRRLLGQFRDGGGRGLEVCCGSSDAADIEASAREANDYGLAGSVASDFHGRFQPWIRLGGVAPLPDGVAPIAAQLGVPI